VFQLIARNFYHTPKDQSNAQPRFRGRWRAAYGSLVPLHIPRRDQLDHRRLCREAGGAIGGWRKPDPAEALGVPPTPDAVQNVIVNGDPATVQAKLSEAEVRMQTEVE
jgi:hypothetical protein